MLMDKAGSLSNQSAGKEKEKPTIPSEKKKNIKYTCM